MTTICTTTGTLISSKTRIADGFFTRFIGLLDRGELDVSEGLLLVPGGSIHTFGMRFAIDVLFLDRDSTVLSTCSDVPPWRAREAPRGTHAVLELAAGRVQQLGLRSGAKLLLHQQSQY